MRLSIRKGCYERNYSGALPLVGYLAVIRPVIGRVGEKEGESMSMKSAEQWQEELAGETSLESYRQVQADAIRHAAIILAGLNKRTSPVTALLEEADRIEKGQP